MSSEFDPSLELGVEGIASGASGLDNPNPVVRGRGIGLGSTRGDNSEDEEDDVPMLQDDELQDIRDMIWDIVSSIKDPEFNYNLEDLYIVKEKHIQVSRFRTGRPFVELSYKPTVPHCSQALTIGLCLAHSVGSSIPGIKFKIGIQKGTHQQEKEITKQINDKERVAAAMENPALKALILKLLAGVPGRE